MATIVKYTTEERPLNAYPDRIISPARPRACCRSHMAAIGPVEADGGWKFFYKRCRVCGFTVRHFLSVPAWIDLQGIFGIDRDDGLDKAA